MKNKEPEQQPVISKGTRLPIIPILVVGITIIASIAYVVYQEFVVGKRDTVTPTQEISEPPQVRLEQPKIPIPPPEAPVVKSYTGLIVSIDSETKKIVLETEYGNKEVLYGDATDIIARSSPTREQLTTLTPEELAQAVSQELTYSGQLSAGDIITAISEENIREFISFEASKIIIIK